MSARALVSVLVLSASLAHAADEELLAAQRAQLEAVRAELTDQVQFQAFDLIDELVYGWTQTPLFGAQTPVVLADVNVPVGFGSGLQALVENHFVSVVTNSTHTNVTLAHCPQCTTMLVHSGAKGTIVARGVDEPEALAAAGALAHAKHALFLDFEFEGAALVLRARVTSLEPSLPIVFSRTLTTTTSSPALLRSPDHLKSAPDARAEYLEILQSRGLITVPVRVGVRSYAPGNQGGPALTAPYIWLQAGLEVALSQARAWTAAFSVGATWLPQIHFGLSAQARISRLLTGTTTSLTHPDLYAYFATSVIYVQGQNAQMFADSLPNLSNLAASANRLDPSALLGAFQVGLELRVKNRIGIIGYLETYPALDQSPNIGRYVDVLIRFQAIGVEVVFCF